MKKSAFLSLIFSLAFICTGSAKPFFEGWYITPEKDTIYGLIKGNKEYLEGNSFAFKENDDSAPVDIYPDKAIKFYYSSSTDNHFVAKSFTLPGTTSSQTKFVRIWIQDALSFYSFVSENKEWHYMVEDDVNGLTVLPPKVRTENGMRVVDKKYLRILRKYVKSCPEAEARIKTLQYNRNDIIALVKKFNLCKQPAGGTDASLTYIQPKKKYKIRFYGGAGSYLTSDMNFTCGEINVPPFCLEIPYVSFRNNNNFSYHAMLAFKSSQRSQWKLNVGALFRTQDYREVTLQQSFFAFNSIDFRLEMERGLTLKKLPWFKPFFSIGMNIPFTFGYDRSFINSKHNSINYISASVLRGGIEIGKGTHHFRLTVEPFAYDLIGFNSIDFRGIGYQSIQLSYGVDLRK